MLRTVLDDEISRTILIIIIGICINPHHGAPSSFICGSDLEKVTSFFFISSNLWFSQGCESHLPFNSVSYAETVSALYQGIC